MLCLGIVLGLIVAVSSTAFAQTTTSVCYGDVNKDQRVDLDDYSLIARNLLQPIKDTNLDLSGDFRIDLSDYALFSSKFSEGFDKCQNDPTKYYISPSGSDSNPGTVNQPFATIAKAISLIKSNNQNSAIVYLQPGIYRQRTDIVSVNGSDVHPILITAQQPGTVTVSGGESSKSVNWVKGTGNLSFPAGVGSHIYYADVSSWAAAPQLATYTSSSGVARLPIAREPDFDIYAPTADTRWTAEKNDSTNPKRTLIATTANPAGSTAGNLQTINGFATSFLTGGSAFIKDTYSAHDEYRGVITAHDPVTGKLTFDSDLTYYDGNPLVGPNSKYYVEGKSQLLDTPGEWIYEPTQNRIYIWPINDVSPATQDIEFAVRNVGFLIRNSRNITIKGINITAINYLYTRNSDDEGAILISNKDPNHATQNITIDDVNITHVGVGVRIRQTTDIGKLTQNIHIQNSEIAYADGVALNAWHWPNQDASGNFIPGIVGLYLDNNEIHHSAFRPAATMIWLQQTQNIAFRNNYIHDSPHNAVEVQGGDETNMLVMNNLFSHNCINGSDCGGFKVWGYKGHQHNVLIMNNISEGTVGCSYASKVANRYVSSKGEGCGGFGFYSDVDHTSVASDPAVVLFRNLAVNNNYSGFHMTRSDDHVLNQNLAVNNPAGFRSNIGTDITEKLRNTKIMGNLWINSNNSTLKSANFFGTNTPLYDVGISLPMDAADRDFVKIDGNAYAVSGQASKALYVRPLNVFSQQKNYGTVSEIQANTPWEDNGRDTSVPATLPTSSGFEIMPYLQNAGISTTPLAEVSATMSRLRTALGINIPLETWVGRK